MSRKGMNRRQFLQTSGTAVAGTAAVIGSGTVLIDPKGAWAMSLKVLDEHTALTLVRVCRTMYPHDRLGDIYYAKVVEGLDAKAADDKELATLLTGGVADLDKAVGGVKWVELSNGNEEAALKQIDTTPFFQKVRGEVIVGLYNNPDVWRHFGYEGASAEFGGYIDRGFNDLGWLQDT